MRSRTAVYTTVVFSLALASGVAAQERGPAELATADVPPGARRITYGTDAMHFGELRLPTSKGPYAVVIVVHGGCYLSKLGSYPAGAVALDNMRPLAAALTEAGFATWNIEYRRIDQPGGGWPGTFVDVAAATDFLRTFAGRERLDLTRVTAIGHSAGGHLAMWLAARHRIPASSDLYSKDPLRLAGSVNLDGPANLRATLDVEKQICGSPVITNLLGGPPESRADRYRVASPSELLPYGGDQVFLGGRMFGAQVMPYTFAAKELGESIRATHYPMAGHFLFIDPQSWMWPDVLKAVRRSLGEK
jgi:acetyl esterase/lipase